MSLKRVIWPITGLIWGVKLNVLKKEKEPEINQAHSHSFFYQAIFEIVLYLHHLIR